MLVSKLESKGGYIHKICLVFLWLPLKHKPYTLSIATFAPAMNNTEKLICLILKRLIALKIFNAGAGSRLTALYCITKYYSTGKEKIDEIIMLSESFNLQTLTPLSA